MKHKKATKRHMFVLFSVMSVLFSVMACNEDDDSVVPGSEDNNLGEKGFRVMNVVDLQKIERIAGDFSDICDTLNIKPYGCYTMPDNTHWHSDKACLWLYPVSASTKYYGMAANSNSGCGVFARITPGQDSFVMVETNIKDLYARVRLVRNISKEQW